HLGAGQKPTPAEDRELIGVYHTIEHYLTTEEPLRSFTKAELRHIITHEFNLEPPAASKLWPDG
ncbi:MAG TPA: hypothetical protein VHQ86_01405, partial [Candidatus Saccharimonadia bacterium]|nr:hypothetical protein [Candidatus Saccharimonadia bacterium]